jgi:N utilization substance protein B
LRDPTHEPFARRLFDGVVARQHDIDRRLSGAATNWRLARMPAVDRNILRIGTLELMDSTDPTPPPVVINEAIELARRYGGADSPSFVNGVLDQLQKPNPDAELPPVPSTSSQSPSGIPQH